MKFFLPRIDGVFAVFCVITPAIEEATKKCRKNIALAAAQNAEGRPL